MLGFFRFASFGAGIALLGALASTSGGCGPATGTCSSDNHQVLDANGAVIATCTSQQACATPSTGAGGCAVCDPTQCLPGNTCITGWVNYNDAVAGNTANQTSECRLSCKAPTDCPFNYHCFDPGSGNAYCVKDRTSYKPPTGATGESAGGLPWGAPCSPQKGFSSNSDCDSSQSFWCYGISPTDANAFCTQFQCNDDGDCPSGWWCGTINDSPNVTTTKRGINPLNSTYNWGSTTTVCLPRTYNLIPGTYCAPCKSDVDCPTNKGSAQHCVSADGNGGTEKLCAAECAGNSNCPLDYKCADPGSGTTVCLPRAATCTGHGGFCDPCHSDKDCGSGFCFLADYSTEHFCTAPTPSCTLGSTGFSDSCPTLPQAARPPNTTTDGVGCTCTGNSQCMSGVPLNQCWAGGQFGLGCYTYHCVGAGSGCSVNSDCCSNKCANSGGTNACL